MTVAGLCVRGKWKHTPIWSNSHVLFVFGGLLYTFSGCRNGKCASVSWPYLLSILTSCRKTELRKKGVKSKQHLPYVLKLELTYFPFSSRGWAPQHAYTPMLLHPELLCVQYTHVGAIHFTMCATAAGRSGPSYGDKCPSSAEKVMSLERGRSRLSGQPIQLVISSSTTLPRGWRRTESQNTGATRRA